MNFLYSFYFFVWSKLISIKHTFIFWSFQDKKIFLPSSWIFKSTSIHLNTFPHGNNLPYLLRCSLRENESRKVKTKQWIHKMKLASNYELSPYIISWYCNKLINNISYLNNLLVYANFFSLPSERWLCLLDIFQHKNTHRWANARVWLRWTPSFPLHNCIFSTSSRRQGLQLGSPCSRGPLFLFGIFLRDLIIHYLHK